MSSENFSEKTALGAKTLYRAPVNLAFKVGVPVGIQYVIYWFFTAVINATLLHGHADAPVAAIGVTAVAYMLKHFHRHLTRPSVFDSLVELAKFDALLAAAQKATDESPAHNGAYL